MMKKKLVCILLVFALTAAGATACGTAGTDAGSSAQKAQTESSAGEEVTEEEGEKTEPDAAENLEVNEYGLTEEEWNLLMEKISGQSDRMGTDTVGVGSVRPV